MPVFHLCWKLSDLLFAVFEDDPPGGFSCSHSIFPDFLLIVPVMSKTTLECGVCVELS